MATKINILFGSIVGFIFTIFYGCTNNISVTEQSSFTISTDNNVFLIDSLLENRNCVFLESSHNSIIADISRIFIKNGYIYILDRKGQKIVIFSLDGSYIRSLKKVGVGPGEYIQIADFSIDNSGRFFVYSEMPSKLIIYDTLGNLLSEQMFKQIYFNMSLLNDKIVFSNIPTAKYSFTVLDIKDGNKMNFLQSLSQYNNVFFKGVSSSTSENSIFVARRFDNKIYQYSNELWSEINLDFNGGFVTNRFLNKEKNNKSFFKICSEQNLVFSITDAQLINDNIILKTNLNTLHILNSEDKLLKSVKYIEDLNYHISLYPSDFRLIDGNSKLLSFIKYPDELIHLFHKGSFKNLSDTLFLRKISELNENSNPVIFLYNFK